MPIITDMKIQKNNKTRANVYIDGEFAFALEMLTVMKLGLKIGMEVSSERLDEAIFDSEKSVAFEKAMNYLSRSMKTSKQMREYLAGKGYSAQIVDYVVDKLTDYKYIDDEQYAKTYAEQSARSKGNRRIKTELTQKGISAATAENYALTDEQSQSTCRALAEKYMSGKPRDVKTLQKLQRYLLYRGYEYDVVNGVLREYRSDDEQ